MNYWRNPDEEIRRAQQFVEQGGDPGHYLNLLHRSADPRYYLETRRLLGFPEFLIALAQDGHLDPALVGAYDGYKAPSLAIISDLLTEHNHTVDTCHGIVYPGHCCFNYLITRPMKRDLDNEIICALCQDLLATDGPNGPWIGGQFYRPACVQPGDIDDMA